MRWARRSTSTKGFEGRGPSCPLTVRLPGRHAEEPRIPPLKRQLGHPQPPTPPHRPPPTAIPASGVVEIARRDSPRRTLRAEVASLEGAIAQRYRSRLRASRSGGVEILPETSRRSDGGDRVRGSRRAACDGAGGEECRGDEELHARLLGLNELRSLKDSSDVRPRETSQTDEGAKLTPPPGRPPTRASRSPAAASASPPRRCQHRPRRILRRAESTSRAASASDERVARRLPTQALRAVRRARRAPSRTRCARWQSLRQRAARLRLDTQQLSDREVDSRQRDRLLEPKSVRPVRAGNPRARRRAGSRHIRLPKAGIERFERRPTTLVVAVSAASIFSSAARIRVRRIERAGRSR